MKNVSTVLRVVALIACVVSLVLLFVDAGATVNSKTWGVSSSGGRIDLDSDFSYRYYNYFEAMEYLSNRGFDDFLRPLAVGLLGLTMVVLFVSLFVKSMNKFFFAVIPLVLVVILFMVADGFTSSYVISGPKYEGTILNYRIYSETTIRFYIDLLVNIILAIGTFVFQLVAGLLDMSNSRKQPVPVAEIPVAPVTPSVLDSDANVVDQLVLLQGMLEKELITQEEFDAKKQQLLGQ